MDTHLAAILDACTRAAYEERLTCAEIVQRLDEVAVERYHTDFLRGERTYYTEAGGSHVTHFHHATMVPAPAFDAARIEAALRALQRREIRYQAFTQRLLAAGCVGYFVSLAGRQVLYVGRGGEVFVERFGAPRPARQLAAR